MGDRDLLTFLQFRILHSPIRKAEKISCRSREPQQARPTARCSERPLTFLFFTKSCSPVPSRPGRRYQAVRGPPSVCVLVWSMYFSTREIRRQIFNWFTWAEKREGFSGA
jgi:hypothetical protein